MSKCLILITSQYPYFSSEPFLESEITYHPRYFEKVIIFPLDISSSDTPTRLLPDGIECFNTARGKNSVSRLGDVIKGGVKCLIRTDAFNEDKQKIGRSVVKRVFLEYFEARSRRHFEQIRMALFSTDFSAYDEVVIYSYWMFAAARVALLLKESLVSEGLKVRLITRAHHYDLYEYANSLNYLPMKRYLLSKFDDIFPCSVDGKEYLIKDYPEFESKISVSYLGTFDKGLSGSDDVFRIVSCSRIIPLKRLDKLIDSLALLINRGIEFEWTHIGGGEELNKLKAYAAQKLDFMKCNFLGSVSNNEVFEYYKTNNISLFVNTSSEEGLPVSIMEAISFGIPIVATNVGGTKEIVIDNVTGSLINKDFSDEELANEIVRFAKMDTQEFSNFRMRTRKFWEDNFNAEKNYSEFLENLAYNKDLQRK